MTATDIDVDLSGVDVDGVPPCECQIGPEPVVDCGQPSVARVHFICHRCGYNAPTFICARCLELLREETGCVVCSCCHSPDYTWSEI